MFRSDSYCFSLWRQAAQPSEDGLREHEVQMLDPLSFITVASSSPQRSGYAALPFWRLRPLISDPGWPLEEWIITMLLNAPGLKFFEQPSHSSKMNTIRHWKATWKKAFLELTSKKWRYDTRERWPGVCLDKTKKLAIIEKEAPYILRL